MKGGGKCFEKVGDLDFNGKGFRLDMERNICFIVRVGKLRYVDIDLGWFVGIVVIVLDLYFIKIILVIVWRMDWNDYLIFKVRCGEYLI